MYYKAILLENIPFINWALWADSLEKLEKMELTDDPLIRDKGDIPENVYGVCPLKIVDGLLIERTAAEMNEFRVGYERKIILNGSASKLKDINSGVFSYDGNIYPMFEAARIRYMAVAMDTTSSDTEFMTIKGEIITIHESFLPAFFNAYYKNLQSITTNLIS